MARMARKLCSPEGVPDALTRVPSRAYGSVPIALRAFQVEPWLCSRWFQKFHVRFARSRWFQEPRWGVPGALRAFQIEPEALFQGPFGQFQEVSEGGGRRYYLLPTNFTFGTWVARLIAAPLNLRARRVHQEGRNDLQLAAVEPTSDSALPIRAKLFGGPDKICTWPPLSPFESSSKGPRG